MFLTKTSVISITQKVYNVVAKLITHINACKVRSLSKNLQRFKFTIDGYINLFIFFYLFLLI